MQHEPGRRVDRVGDDHRPTHAGNAEAGQRACEKALERRVLLRDPAPETIRVVAQTVASTQQLEGTPVRRSDLSSRIEQDRPAARVVKQVRDGRAQRPCIDERESNPHEPDERGAECAPSFRHVARTSPRRRRVLQPSRRSTSRPVR